MEGEFQDWEVLHGSDSDSLRVSSPELRNLEEIEGETEDMIRSDYFSLDNQSRYGKTAVVGGDVSEEGSVESDNPSWIDPVSSETRYARKNSGEFWSDSSSERSDERKVGDFDLKNKVDFAENEKTKLGFEGTGEMETKNENLGKFESDSIKFSDFTAKRELGFVENLKREQDFGEIQVHENDSARFLPDSGGDGLLSTKFAGVQKDNDIGFEDGAKMRAELESSGECDGGNIDPSVEMEGVVGDSSGNEIVAVEETKSCVKAEEEKGRVAWWKVPFEVLKYCVFKVSPVWSFSVAAAVMGFVILGRRLYKMKRKSRSLQLKVTVDDKKVSQFMSRAARLNEAFSVVRRVPIVRPALPSSGVHPWPVMSLR